MKQFILIAVFLFFYVTGYSQVSANWAGGPTKAERQAAERQKQIDAQNELRNQQIQRNQQYLQQQQENKRQQQFQQEQAQQNAFNKETDEFIKRNQDLVNKLNSGSLTPAQEAQMKNGLKKDLNGFINDPTLDNETRQHYAKLLAMLDEEEDNTSNPFTNQNNIGGATTNGGNRNSITNIISDRTTQLQTEFSSIKNSLPSSKIQFDSKNSNSSNLSIDKNVVRDKIKSSDDIDVGSLMGNDDTKTLNNKSKYQVKRVGRIFEYEVKVHISNYTNKNIIHTADFTYDEFTLLNRIPCWTMDQDGNPLSIKDCFNTSFSYYSGNPFIIGKEGWEIVHNFWSDKQLENKIPKWDFDYTYYYPTDNLSLKITDNSASGKLTMGPDRTQTNTPLKYEIHGRTVLDRIVFDDKKGIVLSYSIKKIGDLELYE